MDSKILIFVMALVASDANPVWTNGKDYVPNVIVRIGRSPNVAYGYISGFNSNIGDPFTSFESSFHSGYPQAYGALAGSHNGGSFVRGVGIAPSTPFMRYQQSSAAVDEGFRRVGSAASFNNFEPNYRAIPFAQTYNGVNFGVAATSIQNEGLARYQSTVSTPKNLRGFGSSVAAVSTANGNGYSAAVSSSSNFGNGFGSAISSSHNDDGANYKAVILTTENNNRIGGNTGQAVHQQVGTSTSSIRNGEPAQNLKGHESSNAVVSSNNGDGYRAMSSAHSFGGGFASAISSTHGSDGFNNGKIRGNTVQVIQQQAGPRGHNQGSGFAYPVSSTHSKRLNNGFEYKAATSNNNLGSGIGSSVSSTHNTNGIKYIAVVSAAKNDGVFGASTGSVIPQQAKSPAQTHSRVNFDDASISFQNEGLVYNPRGYGSSVAAVSTINGVGDRTAISTADNLGNGVSAGAYAQSTGAANNGAGYKVAVFKPDNPITLGSVVSSTVSTDGVNYRTSVSAAENNSGIRGNTNTAQSIQQRAGSVHAGAYSLKGPGFSAAKYHSSSDNIRYY